MHEVCECMPRRITPTIGLHACLRPPNLNHGTANQRLGSSLRGGPSAALACLLDLMRRRLGVFRLVSALQLWAAELASSVESAASVPWMLCISDSASSTPQSRDAIGTCRSHIYRQKVTPFHVHFMDCLLLQSLAVIHRLDSASL